MTDNGTSTNSHGGRDGGDLAAETIAQALPYCRTCRRALNVEVSPAGTVRLRRCGRDGALAASCAGEDGASAPSLPKKIEAGTSPAS